MGRQPGGRATVGPRRPGRRRVQAVFSVDLFNEGIDVPAVDTVLMLRPTESPTLFLQQLGRGLRRSPGKALYRARLRWHRTAASSDSTVGIGPCSAEAAGPREQIEQTFPFPTGGLPLRTRPGRPRRRPSQHPERDPLRVGASVCRTAAWVTSALRLPGREWARSGRHLRRRPELDLRGGGGRHADAPRARRRRPLRAPAASCTSTTRNGSARTDCCSPGTAAIPDRREGERATVAPHARRSRRRSRAIRPTSTLQSTTSGLISRFEQNCFNSWRCSTGGSTISTLASPLTLTRHCRYTLGTHGSRSSALGVSEGAKIAAWQSGVYEAKAAKAELFAFTLDKSSGGFSPTTRYRDDAVSRTLIHWESQSTTSAASPTGQRYIHHAERGSKVLLFRPLAQRRSGFLVPGDCALSQPRRG